MTCARVRLQLSWSVILLPFHPWSSIAIAQGELFLSGFAFFETGLKFAK